MKKLTIVAPAFNEEGGIEDFCRSMDDVLAGLSDRYACELLIVDDGSTDGTRNRVTQLAAENPCIRGVFLSRNFGHQAALTAGISFARGDAVITMDCDFQDPPELIPKLIEEWEAGNKIVYARRVQRQDTFFKKITAELYYRSLGKLSDVEIPRQVADYRLMDRLAVDELLRLGEHARYLRGMVAWLGFKHTFVDFERPGRIHGETHYPFMKMVRFAMDGILSFSFKPLRLAMWVGLVSMACAGAFLVYMLFDHFVRGVPYPLFKWLTVILFGFTGAQFMFLWIVGEYVGRIYGDVRRRPLFVIEDTVNVEDGER
jgi:glycosyltransferase involved in cell wall biosynthesis